MLKLLPYHLHSGSVTYSVQFFFDVTDFKELHNAHSENCTINYFKELHLLRWSKCLHKAKIGRNATQSIPSLVFAPASFQPLRTHASKQELRQPVACSGTLACRSDSEYEDEKRPFCCGQHAQNPSYSPVTITLTNQNCTTYSQW